jgi:tetratricopeptide (TPR) repeat protein
MTTIFFGDRMLKWLMLSFLVLAHGCATFDPDRRQAMTHYSLGVLHLEKGDNTSAIKELQESERLYNKDPRVLHTLGLAYYKKGEVELALQQFKKAQELGQDSKIIAEEFNIISEKLKELNIVSEKLRSVVDASLADAASSLKAGRYTDAIANYKAVLLIDRGNREAAAGLQNAARLRSKTVEKMLEPGVKASKEGNYYQAMAAFNEVLQIDGKNTEARRLRKEMKEKLDELLTPLLKEGIEAYKKGDIGVAVVSFKKVLNVEPGNKEAKEYLGKMDIDKAKASIEKEVEKHYLSGIRLYTDGKYKEAIESWKKVLELEPMHQKAAMNIEKTRRKIEGVTKTMQPEQLMRKSSQ